MIQLLLARTVSSLCNCVTFFSGGPRSTGPSFHYRGFNKTRNDQTEYEIDSLLMEDDLVDELVATPLSAEEIAAKLSSSNSMKHNVSNHQLMIENNNNSVDGWINNSNSNANILKTDKDENKINNNWWSDGDDDDVDTLGESIINTTFFSNNSSSNRANINDLVFNENNNINQNKNLYFDDDINELNIQTNISNNQLKDNNWDKEFLNNYKDPLNLVPSINIDEPEEVLFQDNYNWNNESNINQSNINESSSNESNMNELNISSKNQDLKLDSNYEINLTNDEYISNYNDFDNKLIETNATINNELIDNFIIDSKDINLNATKIENNSDLPDSNLQINNLDIVNNSFDNSYSKNNILTIDQSNSNENLIFDNVNTNYQSNSIENDNIDTNNKLLDDFDDIFNNTTFVSSDNNNNKYNLNNDDEFNMFDFISAKSPTNNANNNSVLNDNLVQSSVLFE